jgi:hypothetical protein
MRKAIWCFFLTCAASFAQSTPDNAALEALKKRLLSMNLLNPPGVPKPIVLAGPMTPQSKVCSIPLLRVIPPGTSDKMPAIKPPNKVLKGDTVQVPAPACDEALFTNNK